MSLEKFSQVTPEEKREKEKSIEKEITVFKSKVEEQFNTQDQEEINEAFNWMLDIHAEQEREEGAPYAIHPLEVANKVIDLEGSKDQVVSALLHDTVEDQAYLLFTHRLKRRFPEKNDFLKEDQLRGELEKKYNDIFRNWAFKEINNYFGDNVEKLVEDLTNYDYESLVKDLNLNKEQTETLKNELYQEHLEEIIEKPKTCLVKFADLSTNIDLKGLAPESRKYKKLKIKYKTAIKTFLDLFENIKKTHPLFSYKNQIIEELSKVYETQYN